MRSGFNILEHPSDIGIAARGRSITEAFENAALGLMSIMVDSETIEATVERSIALSASDVDNLLVKWLSEILYLYDAERFVTAKPVITDIGPTGLRGTVKGESLDPTKHAIRLDVKAITYHQLLIRETENGCEVTVFVDI